MALYSAPVAEAGVGVGHYGRGAPIHPLTRCHGVYLFAVQGHDGGHLRLQLRLRVLCVVVVDEDVWEGRGVLVVVRGD